MARRPENPNSRGRRSDVPLDWLTPEDQPEQQAGPAPEGDDWRVSGVAATNGYPPAGGFEPQPTQGSAGRGDARPGPYASPSDARPDGPRAEVSAPPMGRRAARAQREALEAEQARAQQARGGQSGPMQSRPEQTRPAPSRATAPWTEQTQVGQSWGGPAPADQSRADQTQVGQSWGGPAPADQTQVGQSWGGPAGPAPADQTRVGQPWPRQRPFEQLPADQTQVGQGWTGNPQPGQLRAEPAPVQHGQTERQRAVLSPNAPPQGPAGRQAFDFSPSPGYSGPQAPSDGRGARPERAERPEQEPKSGPRRRWVAVGLTLAALVLAGWSATAFVDSATFPVTALAVLAPLVSVLALPVIAIGVASKHLVPTGIAVIAALLPWTLVTGYAAAGPGDNSAGKSATLRVMSVDGAKGRASAKDIVQVTRLYAVDVVVITDLSSTQAHDLTVAGLNALAPSRWVNVTAGGVNGTGLWARPNIENLTATTGLSRVGVDGLIAAGPTKIGITVVHLAGHPLRPGAAWGSDLSALATRTPPAPESFIVGDLNAGPWQPAFRKLTSSKWRDSADVIGQGLRPTWPSWSPLPIAPTDHVLVSKGLGVSGAETTNIAGSSHRALIVSLILPTGGD